MAFDEASATVVTVTTGNIVASPGDMIFVMVREIIASPATPSGTGLPGFTAQTLTSGNANNGDDTVRGVFYRTVCGISFNATLSFANSAFGYTVYVYAGLDTGGTNGSNSVRQAIGDFVALPGSQTCTYASAVLSGNPLVAGFIGGSGSDNQPLVPRSGWTNDYAVWTSGDDVFVSSQSRATTDTAADVTFSAATALSHGIALELQVASAGGNPWYAYAQQ